MKRIGLLFAFVMLLSSMSFGQQRVTHEVLFDNLVIVLDGSGSMDDPLGATQQSRMNVAKQSITQVLSQVDEDTRVGVLVFNAGLKNPWVYEIGPRDLQAIENSIKPILSSGPTPLGQFIKLGADALLRERENQFNYGNFDLIVVTDGEASDQKLMERFAPEIVARGLSLDVIGLDMEGRHVLAKYAHSYRSANDPESLNQALTEVLAEVPRGSEDSAEIYETIAPLSNEVALAIIEGFTSRLRFNHPIGDPAPVQVASTSQVHGQAAVQTQSADQSTQNPKEGDASLWFLAGACIVVVIFAVGMASLRR